MRMKQCIGLFAVGAALLLGSCQDNTYILTNNCINRSFGPNVVGGSIEFAYNISMPYGSGHLVSASVEASIAGADSTYMEHRLFHTGDNDEDVGVEIGAFSVNNGNTTTVTFTKDTVAATLRYYYMIPQTARGKQVSFRFSAIDSNGKEAFYDMGPYNVENYLIDEDGLIITTNPECYVSSFDLVGTDVRSVIVDVATIDTVAQEIHAKVRYGADLKNLFPQFTLVTDAKLDPKITGFVDFSDLDNPRQWTVVSGNRKVRKTYTVYLTVQEP